MRDLVIAEFPPRQLITGDGPGAQECPAWGEKSYQQFIEIVTDPAYPCYLGTAAARRDELFFGFLSAGHADGLCQMLNRFVGLLADKRRDRANLVVFFEPDAVPLSHGEYRTGFWEMLCALARQDPAVAGRRPLENFDDPSWEFSFADQEFFVVAAVPTFVNRRSRNLGQGMVVIFQPRQVFVGEANKEAVRQLIRQRGVAWDGIPSHPDLGVYGEPHNREWTQYFLSDDSEREHGCCPLATSRG